MFVKEQETFNAYLIPRRDAASSDDDIAFRKGNFSGIKSRDFGTHLIGVLNEDFSVAS